MVKNQAREIRVEALVTRDELVAERQAGQQPALLQPEDGAEAASMHSLSGGLNSKAQIQAEDEAEAVPIYGSRICVC